MKKLVSYALALLIVAAMALPVRAAERAESGEEYPEGAFEVLSVTISEPFPVDGLDLTAPSAAGDAKGGAFAVGGEELPPNAVAVLGEVTIELVPSGDVADIVPEIDAVPGVAPGGIVIGEEPAGVALAAAPALVDLSASNLSVGGGYNSGSLPHNTYIPFNYTIRNESSLYAYGVDVTVYVDNTELGAIALGSLPGNYAWSATTQLSFLNGTGHAVRFIVNKDRTIHESRYDNNIVAGTYNFEGPSRSADLRVYGGITAQPGTLLTCRDEVEFECPVVNFGPDSADVAVDFLMNGQPQGTHRIYDLEAGWGVYIYASVAVNTAGTHSAQFDLRCTNGYDPNTSNNTGYCPITVTMDTDLFAGKWASANGLSVNVYQQAVSLTGASTASIASAITEWHSASDNVRFSVSFPVQDTEAQITVTTYQPASPSWESGVAARTRLYKGNEVEIEGSDILTDASTYTKCYVELNRDTDAFPTLTAAQKLSTITH